MATFVGRYDRPVTENTSATTAGETIGPTLTLIPPAGMQAGDLVVISAVYREGTLTPTLAIGNDGGQTWTAETQRNRSATRHRVFHAVFDGTWDANPTVTVTSGTQPMMATMLVYRPATGFAFVFDASAGGDAAPPASSTTDLVRALPAATGAGVSLVLHASQIPNVWANQDWSGVGGGTGVTNEYRRTANSFGASLAFSERLRAGDEAAQDIAIRQTSGTLASNTWTFLSYREVATAAALEASTSASATATASLTTGVLLGATAQATSVAEALLLGSAPPLGASASAGASIVATLRGSDAYAVIEEGRVVGIVAGPPPPSTSATFYWPIGEPSSYPGIGWYFVEPCNVFSPTAPLRAPGDIVPPFPPNTETPPDDDEYEPDPEIDGPPPSLRVADLLPALVPLYAAPTPLSVSAAPGSRVEVSEALRVRVDLGLACRVRLQARIAAPLSGAALLLCYSLDDGATWAAFDERALGQSGPWVAASIERYAVGRYVPVPVEAQGDVLLSVFVESSSETGSVEVGPFQALVSLRLADDIACPVEPDFCLAIPDTLLVGTGTPLLRDTLAYASSAELRAAGYLPPAGVPDAEPFVCEANGEARGAFMATNDGGQAVRVRAHAGATRQWLRHVVLFREPLTFGAFAADPDSNFGPLGRVLRTGSRTGATSSNAVHLEWSTTTTWRLTLGVTATYAVQEAFSVAALMAAGAADFVGCAERPDDDGALRFRVWINGALVLDASISSAMSGPAGLDSVYFDVVRLKAASGADRTLSILHEAYLGGDPYGLL